MVSRRKKRKAGGHEESIPSPPGYSAVPVKFSAKQQAPHYLYMRQHRVRQGTQSTWPPDRTLFILNVPPYCTQESLSRCLSCCGTIKTVELQEKPDLAESPTEPKSQFFHPKPVPGFQVAYVVFQKPSGVSAALNLKGPLLVSTESHLVKSGIHSQYCWLCPVLLPQALGWSRHFLGAASMNATSCAPLFLKAWAGRGYF
ncbi:ribosomal RNA-processing protein 7 homolog A isoform 2 [Mus musculus]|uniref:ribosomal RNA-processing protein 7 homolog A isoform 2 n=1 Tax=Mus musculus TaxID=10090 RepID=UPI000C1CC265|nr:ribosomal RNA-processing protein 7 homolog A isoform 2 [Mus musculus]